MAARSSRPAMGQLDGRCSRFSAAAKRSELTTEGPVGLFPVFAAFSPLVAPKPKSPLRLPSPKRQIGQSKRPLNQISNRSRPTIIRPR
jgi:hypothetical protein